MINNHSKGLVASIIFHGAIILFALYSFIQIPETFEESELGGIVVNYGTSDQGMGENFQSMEEPAIGENISDQIIEDPNRPESSPEQLSESETGAITQDFEEAPIVTSGKEKTSTNTEATITNSDVTSTPTLNPKATFRGKKNNGTGTGDGTTGQPGNQGKPNGSVLSDNYNGDGIGGGGFALNLDGRRFMIKPIINDNGQLSGKIVVQISVNKDGEIIAAKPGVRGTTITNAELWAKCEKAVLQAKLNALSSAPEIQIGTVVFTFILK